MAFTFLFQLAFAIIFFAVMDFFNIGVAFLFLMLFFFLENIRRYFTGQPMLARYGIVIDISNQAPYHLGGILSIVFYLGVTGIMVFSMLRQLRII